MLELPACYVLHKRAYGDSAYIVDLFSRDHGRLAVIAKGAKQASKRNKSKFSLSEFSLISCVCFGYGDLKKLKSAETAGPANLLQGNNLYSALYLNELLYRLLKSNDAYPRLFEYYHAIVEQLALNSTVDGAWLEQLLRRFEKVLLEELGYGLPLHVVALQGGEIQSGESYHYDNNNGFFLVQASAAQKDSRYLYLGEHLLAIAADDYQLAATRLAAKHLIRQAMQPLLGGKPLLSRSLFRRVSRP